jgi:Protein of unknown function (DUF3592)
LRYPELFLRDTISEAKESETWPSVPGVITDSEITSYVRTNNGKSQTMYSAEVKAVYEVDGKQYSTSMINLAGSSSTSVRSSVQTKVQKYPKGAAVVVFYDPEYPDRAVLEPGMPLLFWILRIAPLVLLAFAALMIIRTILKLTGLVTALGFLAAKRKKKSAAVQSPSAQPAPAPTRAPTGTGATGTAQAISRTPAPGTSNKSDDSDDGFSI